MVIEEQVGQFGNELAVGHGVCSMERRAGLIET